jgi:hypothetical protein
MKLRSALFILLSNLVLASVACAAPELSVERGSFNFGTVAQGKKVQHNFTIRNNGDAPLQIRQLSASCGCTAAKPSASTIPPGRSGEIQVVFDSTNFSGSVEKTVTMSSNAGRQPSYVFKLVGNVVEALQLTPRQLNLGPLTAGVPKQASIGILNASENTIKIFGVTVTSATLQIKPTLRKSELKPGESGGIDLVVTARPEAKVLSGYLHILTSNPAKKEITVPIWGAPVK